MSYSHVNEWSVSNALTLAVAPAALGNLLVLSVRSNNVADNLTAVSGGGVATWTKVLGAVSINPSSAPKYMALWVGKVTTAGAANITATMVDGSNLELVADEYSTTVPSPTWAVDGSAALSNSATASVTFPSLTPALAGIYHGYGVPNGAFSSGLTAGFTHLQTIRGNTIIWNEATVAGTPYAPSFTEDSTESVGMGVIIYATSVPIVTDLADITAATAAGYSVARRVTNRFASPTEYVTDLTKRLTPVVGSTVVFGASGVSTISAADADAKAVTSLNGTRRHRYGGSPTASIVVVSPHGDAQTVDVT